MSKLLDDLLATGNPGVHHGGPLPAFTNRLEAKGDGLSVEMNDHVGVVNDTRVNDYLTANGYAPEEWRVTGMRRSDWTMANGEQGESTRYSFERMVADWPLIDSFDWERAMANSAPAHVGVGSGDHGFVLAIGDLQIGKALSDDTPILTYNRGWANHGDIVPGDYVYGVDGTPREVLAVTGSSVMELRRVHFDGKASLLASRGHRWSGVRRYHPVNYRKTGVNWEWREGTCSTDDLAALQGDSDRMPMRSFRLPSIEAPLRDLADLPIDPYILGFWLGDGSSWSGLITKGKQDADWLNTLGYQIVPNGKCHMVRIEGLTELLGGAGLYRNKHVPEEYLLACTYQRRALLQGLLDSDGHCSPKGAVEFSNTNRDLVDAVAFLAASLGYKATISGPQVGTLNGVAKLTYWRVTFMSDASNPVFLMPRKADRQNVSPQDVTKHHFVQRITDAGFGWAQCLTVDGGMYLAGRELIPTHNCDGDGIEGTVGRAFEYINQAAGTLEWYRNSGFTIGSAHIAWLGDHIEGFESQGGKNAWRTPLGLTDQLRIMRRIMLYAATMFAPLVDRLTMAAVPGNHGRISAANGSVTRADDNFDTDCLIAVGDALAMNPGAYGHVELFTPGIDRVSVTVEVANTVICHVHGHQYAPGKHWAWWQGQQFGGALSGVDVLLAGHLHHFMLDTWGKLLFVQVPSLESESTWVRQLKGIPGNPGVVVALTSDGNFGPIEVIR